MSHSDPLTTLQRRAEAMAQGDFSELGVPVDGGAEFDALRRAIDVLAMHTEQGLRRQHAYVAALSTGQEAERGRLARELHDEIVQHVIALGHGVERARRLVDRDPHAAVDLLSELRTQVTATVDELRAIIGDLRPPALEELGLLPAVELLLQRTRTDALDMTLVVQGEERRLAPQSELALFRLVQEAWNNIRNHAQAQHAEFTFAYMPDELVVTIADDGIGFLPPDDEETPDGHWGLRGMQERAALTGGSLTITSQPGQGTRLVSRIPYPGVGGRDPVCGMAVGPGDLGASHTGALYRFCSPACRDLFLAQPGQYVSPETTGN
jgi:signal transduction histidine kinase/YHS domain-containing protein